MNLARTSLLFLFCSSAFAQPYPMPAAESNMEVEIRYFDAAGSVKLQKIPNSPADEPHFQMWQLYGWVYTHLQPCWKTSSPCVVNSITVKTWWRDPYIGALRMNITGRWCNINYSGQCPMPAFPQVTVPVGGWICMAFDRVKGAWKQPPHVCTEAELR